MSWLATTTHRASATLRSLPGGSGDFSQELFAESGGHGNCLRRGMDFGPNPLCCVVVGTLLAACRPGSTGDCSVGTSDCAGAADGGGTESGDAASSGQTGLSGDADASVDAGPSAEANSSADVAPSA